ncbi:MAG TPA: MFS transporter, partial [Armatimonadota bacterium]|nr:MFS transporter [Armatimonadota bacterium]
SAMTLALSDEHEKGKRLGQMGAYAGLGTSVGIVLVLIFTKSVSFSTWYMTASALVMVSAIMVLFIRRDLTPPDKPRMVLKRKYGLYYALTFLEGCRKQVFITFAVYAMVREYDASLKAVAMLMLINNVTNLLAAPVVGRLIDRIGEKRVLMTSYAALIFVFLGYALIQDLHVLYVLYCLDSLLYLSTYGLTTYLNRIADSRDLVPSLSMGVTMNHVAAVAVPLVGGFLWGALGYQAAFIGGAVVVVISLNLVRRMIIKSEPQCGQ